MFLPKEKLRAAQVQEEVTKDIQQMGFTVLWQRDVPYDYYQCGPGAQKSCHLLCKSLLKSLSM